MAMVTRRRVLQAAAVAAGGLTLPLVRTAGVAGLAPTVVPKGKMTLAWHTNIASRWLDPQQHDGTATPDNFLFANQDALIKNFRDKRDTTTSRSPISSSSLKTPKVRHSSSAPGSSSTMLRRSRPKT